ncbi:alpha/beta fold hydrolase [Amycolatopsis sp. cg5]|uniref:alpha/beta fold hydrolase n=1 Tax=Amycolatopsis sp. cg5 TaxID=3238802 RepID=UPI00352471FE
MSTFSLPDGGHLAYDDLGEGVPVVLLHDGVLHRRAWDQQLPALTDYRVLNLDLRGHGESGDPRSAYLRADDVIALLDHAQVPEAFLVGIGLGATTSMDAVLDYPDRVSGVLASGGGASEQYWNDPFVVDIRKRQYEVAVQGDKESYVELFLNMWVDGPYREPHEVPAAVRERCRDMAMHTVTEHAREEPFLPGRTKRTWERLPEITTKILFVHGELNNGDAREMTERTVSAVPDAKLIRFEGAGHMVNMEQPERFNAVMREFLDWGTA